MTGIGSHFPREVEETTSGKFKGRCQCGWMTKPEDTREQANDSLTLHWVVKIHQIPDSQNPFTPNDI